MFSACGGDKLARVEAYSGASAQEPSSPREPALTSVDDEVNMEMEVEGSVKSQEEQAAEASRRQQREQLLKSRPALTRSQPGEGISDTSTRASGSMDWMGERNTRGRGDQKSRPSGMLSWTRWTLDNVHD